jgi:hypothetical protein
MVLNGQFTTAMKQTHPSRTQANEPFCTWTQEVFYIDAGNNEVARVHQYLRPDGTLGASGLPDPKEVVENGIAYRLRKQPRSRRERLWFFLCDQWDRVCWFFRIEVD